MKPKTTYHHFVKSSGADTRVKAWKFSDLSRLAQPPPSGWPENLKNLHTLTRLSVREYFIEFCHRETSGLILSSWVRASWINVNNCPTRCDYIHFYYISADSSTCFGWSLHPSSGAHVNCNYIIWHWSNRICYLPLTWRSRKSGVPTPPRQRKVANTVRPVPDVVITFWMCSWWWVKLTPETSRAVCRNIIKLYIVASCWTIINTDSRCTGPWT